jgi:hypothetical protein
MSGDIGPAIVILEQHSVGRRQGSLYCATMHYRPNPVHKKRMTEVGRGRWRPNKTPCPDDLTVVERNELFVTSVAADSTDPCSRRYNIRRTAHGLELYEAQCAEVDDDVECHGYPTSHIPAKVLRVLRDTGTITDAEYNKLV